MVWSPDARDAILHFTTIYGACGKTIDYLVDSSLGLVSAHAIPLTLPLEDSAIVAAFHAAVQACAAGGKRARLCVFDTVSSLPGIRMPFAALAAACREAGVLSLVDGAQGVGMLPDLDLAALDPDFFVSNCHKWLHVPRSCAVLYVPVRNQAMMASTLPTSHGYVGAGGGDRFNPLPKGHSSAFVNNFQFVGTLDTSAYLCVKDAILWREQVLGGEAKVMAYVETLAREGGRRVAEMLGTEVLDNKSGSLARCAMTNVALPLEVEEVMGGEGALDWMVGKIMKEYNTFLPIYAHAGRVWVRISAQAYLEMEDFEWAGRMLRDVCEGVKRGEHRSS